MSMKKIFVISMVILVASIAATAQVKASLDKIMQIKPLETNRADVQRILGGFVHDYQDETTQNFSTPELSVEITYASGNCSDDPKDDEVSDVWNVNAGKVVRVEVRFDDDFVAKDLGLDVSKFVKEQTYTESEERVTFHEKGLGIVIESYEDNISMLTLFPAKAKVSSLCKKNNEAKAFYGRTSWFEKKLEERFCCVSHSRPADVQDLILDITILEATTGRRVNVKTIAVDPENDPLTYNYTVSAGKIVGTGANVIWDLTTVPGGIYRITAGVDDGCGICGNTVTRSVTIK